MALAAIAAAAWAAVSLLAQAPSIQVTGTLLHIKAPAFRFITGEALDRLKNGRSVRFDLDLFLLGESGGTPTTQTRASFNLSYDLWEERFAVSRIGTPPRSASHLTQPQAEAWCLEQLTLPVSAFGRLGREAPFWLRLTSAVAERQSQTTTKTNDGFTIWSLIDMLSRRRRPEDPGTSLEAGPFQLPD
jgi:hypothetical protein